MQYFRRAIPELKKATYGTGDEIMRMLDKRVTYPSIYFMRQPTQWDLVKRYRVPADLISPTTDVSFFPVEQTYTAFLLLEKQGEALQAATILRYHFADNPSLEINWPTANHILSVQLRFLYIELDDIRANNHEAGALRAVKVTWRSNLFLTNDIHFKPIKEVRLVVKAKDKTTEEKLTVKTE